MRVAVSNAPMARSRLKPRSSCPAASTSASTAATKGCCGKSVQARADASGIIRLPPPPSARVFCKGDRVKISAGQWASFDAVHTGMSTRERELVLITILGAQRELSVASHLVATQ
jgi:hypothetical protein